MSGYISLEELKNTVELTGYSGANLPLQDAINAASAGIDLYCGRTFSSGTVGSLVTYTFTPQDTWFCNIDDLVSAGTVASDFNGDGVYESVWTANSQYILEPTNAPQKGEPYTRIRIHPFSPMRFTAYTWASPTAWPNSLAVTGQWGWPSVPPTVKEACTIMSMRLLRRAKDAPFGIVNLGIDQGAYRITRQDPDLCFLLDNLITGNQVMAA
jgi:hypothetical protein